MELAKGCGEENPREAGWARARKKKKTPRKTRNGRFSLSRTVRVVRGRTWEGVTTRLGKKERKEKEKRKRKEKKPKNERR
jgi:hypothetical protein